MWVHTVYKIHLGQCFCCQEFAAIYIWQTFLLLHVHIQKVESWESSSSRREGGGLQSSLQMCTLSRQVKAAYIADPLVLLIECVAGYRLMHQLIAGFEIS